MHAKDPHIKKANTRWLLLFQGQNLFTTTMH
jgi:hypothetical protein